MEARPRENRVLCIFLRLLPPFILATGAAIYLYLILPLVQAGGHLDMNPYYFSRSIFFIVPLILSRVLDFAGSRHRLEVIIYILAAIGITAAIPPLNPWEFSFSAWCENLIPAFIFVSIVAVFIELLTKLVLWLIAGPVHRGRGNQNLLIRAPLRRIVLATLIIGAAIYWPNYCVQSEIARAIDGGRQRALADWSNQNAYIKLETQMQFSRIDDLDLSFYYDPDTGLQIMPAWPASDIQAPGIHYADMAYDAAIHQLINVNGYPSWSMKKYMINPQILTKLFENGKFTAIKQFPFQIEKGVQWISPDMLQLNGTNLTQSNLDSSSGSYAVLVLPEHAGDFILRTDEDGGTLFSPHCDQLIDISPVCTQPCP
jgi:hypothetical protein